MKKIIISLIATVLSFGTIHASDSITIAQDSTAQIMLINEVMPITEPATTPDSIELAVETPVLSWNDNTAIYLAAQPDYMYMPLVFEQYTHIDSTAIEGEVDSIALKINDTWLKTAIQKRKNAEELRFLAMIQNPENVQFNANELPEAPKSYIIKTDPSKRTVTIEERAVENIAQVQTEAVKVRNWIHTVNGSVQISQAYLSENWYQGGESTNALNSDFRMTANYNDKQKVQFENTLEIKLGFITAPSDTVHTWKTNADLLRLYSKLGIQAVKNLFYTIDAKLSTQFFPNYKTNTNDLVSAFLSPVQFETSIGMDFKLDKSKYKLSLMGAPFSYTFVYIKNDDIVNPSSFNVDPGHTSANLFGSKITANLDWKIAKDISYVTKLEYFTTYDKVIANWENTFNFQLNRYLSTKLFIHLRYDDGVTLTEENKSYFQLKEMLTFGLSYTW